MVSDSHSQDEQSGTASIEAQGTLEKFAKWHISVPVEGIMTTEDRIKICLLGYQDTLLSRRSWITPASIFVTSFIASITADFKKFIFSGPTWQAVFIIGAVIAAGWAVYEFVRIPKRKTIDDIVSSIKKSSNRSNN